MKRKDSKEDAEKWFEKICIEFEGDHMRGLIERFDLRGRSSIFDFQIANSIAPVLRWVELVSSFYK